MVVFIRYIKYSLGTLLLMNFASCLYTPVPKHIKQNFTYCYSEENTNIEDLININGYYIETTPYTRYDFRTKETVLDTFYRRFMFLKDGLYLDTFLRYDSLSSTFLDSYYIGKYVISGDTIKVQYIDRPNPPSGHSAWETWFKVVSRDTIIKIYAIPLYKKSKSDWKNWYDYKPEWKAQIVPAIFVPINLTPISNCWLKQKKWFWCSESDWKEYMNRVKELNKGGKER